MGMTTGVMTDTATHMDQAERARRDPTGLDTDQARRDTTLATQHMTTGVMMDTATHMDQAERARRDPTGLDTDQARRDTTLVTHHITNTITTMMTGTMIIHM